MRVAAYVQTWFGRDDVAPDTIRSLERAGCEVHVLRHGPGENPIHWVWKLLEKVAERSDDAGPALRVEDDVLVREDLRAALFRWPSWREGMGIGIAEEHARGRRYDFLTGPPAGPIGGLQIFRPSALREVLPYFLELSAPVARAWDEGVDALAVDTALPAAFVRTGSLSVHVHPELLGDMNPRAVSGWGGHKGLSNVPLGGSAAESHP